jgi:hypothetical protein
MAIVPDAVSVAHALMVGAVSLLRPEHEVDRPTQAVHSTTRGRLCGFDLGSDRILPNRSRYTTAGAS